MSTLRRTLRLRGMAAFLLAALVIGVLVGVAAALLIWAVGEVGDLVSLAETDWSWGRWGALLAVPLGLLVSWFIAQRWGPGIEGGGVTPTMVGLSLRAGYLPTRTIPAKAAATAVTLGAGASAGREGPMVQIGAAIGSSLARYTNFGEDQIRSLVAAGAGAGIGASFNAPIAGMLFAMEVILGNFAVRHLNAVVVASVAAAVTARSLVGEERILSGPPHELDAPMELVLYVALGLLAVLFAVFFLRAIERADIAPILGRFPVWTRPIFAGLLVAGLGVAEPRLLGTGQAFVGELIGGAAPDAWWILGLLAAGKILATASTSAGGGAGGFFMPSLFVGAVLGTGLASLVAPVWGFSELDPGAFAVVGMAALFAAVARAPLASIIIVFEITGDYGLVLPLMLAASLATVLTDRVSSDTAYTLPLRRRGIHLPKTEDIDLLDTITVGEVMSIGVGEVAPTATVGEVRDRLEREHHHGLPVVVAGRLHGLITSHDLEVIEVLPSDTIVADVMNRAPITVTPTLPVSAALARMAALGIGRMPVVADDDPARYLGMFRRSSVVEAYYQALGSSRGRELYRERYRQRVHAGAGFFEVPVVQGSLADGVPVRDLEWPEDAILVSIRRGAAVLIPHGDTVLHSGDIVTGFGTSDARTESARVLDPGL
jgi:CIC family chloride channel protein